MSGGFKYIENKRVSKTQKRREAKEAKKAEQAKRIEEGEQLDEHKERRLEQEALGKVLEKHGLKIHDIAADGDCMYRAIEHQLSIASDADEHLTCEEIRKRTGDYISNQRVEFCPYLVTEEGDLMDSKQIDEYCHRIAHTKDWGGHLELTAISRFTHKSISIYQAGFHNPIRIDPEENGIKKTPMLLSYHKHLYRLGNHYNSLIKIGE